MSQQYCVTFNRVTLDFTLDSLVKLYQFVEERTVPVGRHALTPEDKEEMQNRLVCRDFIGNCIEVVEFLGIIQRMESKESVQKV